MDLGIEGRVALVMGASKGLGRGIAAAARRRGRPGRDRQPQPRAARRGGRGARRRTSPPSSPTPATSSGSPSCRARSRRRSGRSTSSSTNTGGPPQGDRARQLDRGVGRGLPLAGARGAGADRGGAAEDARAGLGTDRQRRLQLDRRAGRQPDPLQRQPARRDRVPEDALARGRRRRDHREHDRDRQIRHRPARRKRRVDGEGRTERARNRAGGPPRPPGGVRRPGRLPRLRPRRLHQRDVDPDRRRIAPASKAI